MLFSLADFLTATLLSRRNCLHWSSVRQSPPWKYESKQWPFHKPWFPLLNRFRSFKKMRNFSLVTAVNAGFSPNSPTEDPHGFAAGITMNPLREVFESMNYDENYYLRNNETWHLHDPSNMMLKDGILKGINKFEISEMIRLISGEFQQTFQVKKHLSFVA